MKSQCFLKQFIFFELDSYANSINQRTLIKDFNQSFFFPFSFLSIKKQESNAHTLYRCGMGDPGRPSEPHSYQRAGTTAQGPMLAPALPSAGVTRGKPLNLSERPYSHL